MYNSLIKEHSLVKWLLALRKDPSISNAFSLYMFFVNPNIVSKKRKLKKSTIQSNLVRRNVNAFIEKHNKTL
jgi:hypothetical protein